MGINPLLFLVFLLSPGFGSGLVFLWFVVERNKPFCKMILMWIGQFGFIIIVILLVFWESNGVAASLVWFCGLDWFRLITVQNTNHL